MLCLNSGCKIFFGLAYWCSVVGGSVRWEPGSRLWVVRNRRLFVGALDWAFKIFLQQGIGGCCFGDVRR
jgi:hypothetical protein